jgi:hypothetical protein
MSQKECQRRWYLKHRKRHVANVGIPKEALRQENAAKVLEYKKLHPCIDCGETDPDMLTFDHVRGKKRGGVSEMLSGGCTWKLIEAEIAKCEVRCWNHHMKRTMVERRKRFRGIVIEMDR